MSAESKTSVADEAALQRELEAAESRCAKLEQQLAAAREALQAAERDSRAWRNRFIDERMNFYHQSESYEMRRCYAETDALEFIAAFHAALEATTQRGSNP